VEQQRKPGGSPLKPKNKNRKEDHMKYINTAIRLIAVQLGLATSVEMGADPVAGREEHPMIRSRLRRWTAVLALVIASLATPVMAQETGTITITGTFTSDTGEHTWSVAMYGTTYWHHALDGAFFTEVRATSFDLRFSGPDADSLNRVASEKLAAGNISLELRNVYQGNNLSRMALWIMSPDESASFWAGHELVLNRGVFPFDAAGYPTVTPEPFSFWNEETYISWYGFFEGNVDGTPNAEISGSLGSEVPPPLPTLSIGDASVVEGNRGSRQLQFMVSRSGSSEGTVRVDYRTVAGTARAKSDYTAASGTLPFQPGVWSQTITITVKSDRTREPNETFTVELFNAIGASVVDAVATGTILNDD
jgi:hypothetical protein